MLSNPIQEVSPNPSDPKVKKLINEVEKSEESGVLPQTTPVIVPVCPESYSKINDCFPSVKEKIKRDGGVCVLGWMLHDEGFFMSAEFHAVWESPDKKLLDVTVKGTLHPTDPTKNVTVSIENILFIVAPKATYEGKRRCNIYFNSIDNPLTDDLINCEQGIFYLRNKGALQCGEIMLSDEDTKEYRDIENISIILQQMIRVGMKSYNSDCGCSSRKKYKHCHGKDLRKIIEKNR